MNQELKFIESICYQRGDYQLIDYHQARLNYTYKIFFTYSKPPDLRNVLPKMDSSDQFKIRVIYSHEMIDVEYAAYTPKKIKSFKVIEDNHIAYEHKSANRSRLTELYEKRGSNDDIIIVKNGHITDSYYANLAFFDGTAWYTPGTYLLSGVKRQFLIDQGLLNVRMITPKDLTSFQTVSPINAMLDPGTVVIPCTNIEL